MKTKMTVTLLALGIALPVASLQAQDSSDRPTREGRGPRGDRPIPGVFGALDANNDRTIDKNELGAATEALKKLDKDSDGKLTMGELRGAQGRGPRGEARRGDDGERPNRERPGRAESEQQAGQRPRGERPADRPGMGAGGPFVAALDANKDGTVDADELKDAPTALGKLDKNSDGQISLDEMQIVRGRGPGGRGGDGERPERPRGERKAADDKSE